MLKLRNTLKRIQADTSGAFLDINTEVTLAQARASDGRLVAGTGGCLEGVPIAHKDVFVTRDFVTTAGSKILANYRSPFDATVVQKLANGANGQSGAGMVTLGKLNCDEFAMGSGNENSAFHPVRNPWDASRVPGGSSGGSAAAVAARLTPCRNWHRHWWVDSPTRQFLRYHRYQTYVWARIALRHDCLCF